MKTLLSNDTVDFLLRSNNISGNVSDSYDNKIDKLKSAGLLMKNHDFYRVEENKSKSVNCGCGVNTAASVIKKQLVLGGTGGINLGWGIGGNDGTNTGGAGFVGNDGTYTTGGAGDDTYVVDNVGDFNDTYVGGSACNATGGDIKNYFKDGMYTVFGLGIPSCTFPNGPTYEGDVKIYSTYQCNDLTQPFLQKNIVSETGVSLDDTRISVFTFNINNSAIAVNNLGSAHGGTYTITENKNNEKIILTAVYDEGYDNSLGKNVPIKIVFQLTPAGFTALHYYLDKCKRYQIQSIRNYTYKSA
jgi:hypothetical protein